MKQHTIRIEQTLSFPFPEHIPQQADEAFAVTIAMDIYLNQSSNQFHLISSHSHSHSHYQPSRCLAGRSAESVSTIPCGPKLDIPLRWPAFRFVNPPREKPQYDEPEEKLCRDLASASPLSVCGAVADEVFLPLSFEDHQLDFFVGCCCSCCVDGCDCDGQDFCAC